MPILMTYISRSSGQTLLEETSLVYARDAANLGRLKSRTHTHHDGQGYVTTVAFDCTADPTLAGALLYTRTVTTHDGLKVSTSRSRSALTGRVWRKTDALGVSTTQAYDGLGRLISRTLDAGGAHANTMTFDYTITGGTQEAFQVLTIDSNGNKRCVGLDGAGRTVYVAPNDIDDGLADPDPTQYQTYSRRYDGMGRVASQTWADWLLGTSPERYARTGTVGYDDWGRRSRVDYDDGTWRSSVFDPIGRTVTTTRGGTKDKVSVTLGKRVTTYDLRGRPVKVARYAAGADPAVATPYSTRTLAYDGWHRLRRRTDALGQTTTYDYDAWHRPVRMTLVDGTVLTRTYRQDSARADVVKLTLANAGSKLAETTLGTRVFDGLGRVTSASVGGRPWQYEYDLPDANSQLLDPSPTQVTAPDGTICHYAYIPALSNAIQTVQGYANAAAVTAKQPSITQRFEYDPTSGLMTSAVEGSSTKQYGTYASGRLKTRTLSFDSDTCTMSYDKYTLRGRLRQYTHVDGATRVTQRNANGTVSEVGDGAMKVTLGYDPAGRLSSWTASDLAGATPSLTSTLTRDDYGRETGRTIAAAGDAPTKPSWQITQFWNVADQLILRKTNRAGGTYRMENYKYDSRNRLTHWDGSGAAVNDRYGNVLRTQDFTLDPFGNVTQVVSTLLKGPKNVNGSNTAVLQYTNAADPCQLSSVTNTDSSYPSSASVRYDAAGRITDDGMGQQFTGYDVLGRLTGASSSLSKQQGSYAYDAHNRTYRQTVQGQSPIYFYYQGSALVNLMQDGKATRLLRSPAGCVAQYNGSVVWLSGTDASGSVLAANQGTHTETYGYSAYGEAAPQAAASVLGYTGQYRDPVVPGYQLGNGYRTYLPALMRFAQPDSPRYSPFGAGGIHSYAYCGADPVNGADPSGHFDLFGLENTWNSIWTSIGKDLDAIDPFKLFSKQVITPVVKWFMGQKWAHDTPAYWELYGAAKGYQQLTPTEQQILGQAGRMGEVLGFIPGMGELGAADGITDGIIEGTAEGFDGMASGSPDVVSSWGRIEGDAEPLGNFRAAPPDEPATAYDEEAQRLFEGVENAILEQLWIEFQAELLPVADVGQQAEDFVPLDTEPQLPPVVRPGDAPDAGDPPLESPPPMELAPMPVWWDTPEGSPLGRLLSEDDLTPPSSPLPRGRYHPYRRN